MVHEKIKHVDAPPSWGMTVEVDTVKGERATAVRDVVPAPNP